MELILKGADLTLNDVERIKTFFETLFNQDFGIEINKFEVVFTSK